MKRIIILVIAHIIVWHSNAQTTIKNNIEESLKEFVTVIGDLNDPETLETYEGISRQFYGTNYFKFNGSDMSPIEFMKTYTKVYLESRIINHNLRIQKIEQLDNVSWSVTGLLQRMSGDMGDFRIKDTDIRMIVRYDKDREEVKILSINFSPTLYIEKPKWEIEYSFTVTPLYTNIPPNGGDWKVTILSQARNIKSYDDGVPIEYSEFYNVPFRIKTEASLQIDTTDISNGNIKGRINKNYTKDYISRSFFVEQLRTESNIDSKKVTISQNPIESKFSSFLYDLFYFYDGDAPKHQVSVLYGLKYDMGMSYMYSIPDSRFSVGTIVTSNFDSFKGLDLFITNKTESFIMDYGNSDSELDITNGYLITKNVYFPNNSSYSSKMDPKNEAKHLESKSFFLLQGGVYLCNWIRFDVGMGCGRFQKKYYMKNAYNVTEYSYVPQSDNLPTIDNVYKYSKSGKEWYYKDKIKCHFALRYSVNGIVPIDWTEENFLTIGVGYMHIPNNKENSSFDFSIGYAWRL